jgi:UDP-N-acetylglucosamine 3-dehydrogenase
LKVAQIGTGEWGKNHARVLNNLGVLTAVCDINEENAKIYGKKYSVNHYNSIESLLSSQEFDAAFVCTPTSTHASIASQLIQAKKHTFVEKPMTYLSKKGKELVELAKKNKVFLSCGYIERFNPAVSTVKNFIKSKEFGDLLMLEFHRENVMHSRIKDVGIIYDTAVHDIDTAMWLFDDVPKVVFAKAGQIRHEHEDFVTMMLGFDNNKVAIISSNWITPTKIRTFNAVCTEAVISGNFITQEIKIEKLHHTEIPRHVQQEPLQQEIKSFLGAIENKNELIVEPEQAVNVTKIAEAALLSSKKGIPIYLDV